MIHELDWDVGKDCQEIVASRQWYRGSERGRLTALSTKIELANLPRAFTLSNESHLETESYRIDARCRIDSMSQRRSPIAQDNQPIDRPVALPVPSYRIGTCDTRACRRVTRLSAICVYDRHPVLSLDNTGVKAISHGPDEARPLLTKSPLHRFFVLAVRDQASSLTNTGQSHSSKAIADSSLASIVAFALITAPCAAPPLMVTGKSADIPLMGLLFLFVSLLGLAELAETACSIDPFLSFLC
jgi:hypothetical protein